MKSDIQHWLTNCFVFFMIWTTVCYKTFDYHFIVSYGIKHMTIVAIISHLHTYTYY